MGLKRNTLLLLRRLESNNSKLKYEALNIFRSLLSVPGLGELFANKILSYEGKAELFVKCVTKGSDQTVQADGLEIILKLCKNSGTRYLNVCCSLLAQLLEGTSCHMMKHGVVLAYFEMMLKNLVRDKEISDTEPITKLFITLVTMIKASKPDVILESVVNNINFMLSSLSLPREAIKALLSGVLILLDKNEDEFTIESFKLLKQAFIQTKGIMVEDMVTLGLTPKIIRLLSSDNEKIAIEGLTMTKVLVSYGKMESFKTLQVAKVMTYFIGLLCFDNDDKKERVLSIISVLLKKKLSGFLEAAWESKLFSIVCHLLEVGNPELHLGALRVLSCALEESTISEKLSSLFIHEGLGSLLCKLIIGADKDLSRLVRLTMNNLVQAAPAKIKHEMNNLFDRIGTVNKCQCGKSTVKNDSA